MPSEELNQSIVQEAVARAGRRWPGFPVQLIAPAVIWKETPPGYEHRGPRYPELPTFLCIGHFISSRPRDPEMHGSTLSVVWFQTESPIGGITLDPNALDWWGKAKDFEY